MADSVYITTTSDQKPALRQLVRNLPAMLAGRIPDVAGIAHGFRTRIGFSILGLVVPNFDELGRGQSGADGEKWKPLSPATIAGRRFGPGEKTKLLKEAGLKARHKFPSALSAGGNLTLYKAIYAKKLPHYAMKEDMVTARAHASQFASNYVKEHGAKTKVQVFGGNNRQIQILVDTGRGRGSLTPGQITELGPEALYTKPAGKGGPEQEFDDTKPDSIVVGTNVGYMGAHHRGNKRLPQRKLWPTNFPGAWWNSILGSAISGLVRIGDVFRGGGPI